MKKLLQTLHPGDIATILFLTILSILILVFHSRIEDAFLLLMLNTAASAGIIFYCRFTEKKTGILLLIRDFYMVPGILLIFKEMYILVPRIHPVDYDALLIQIDFWLFGLHPTQWMFQFSTPLITEILQVAYSLFYILLVIIAIDLYKYSGRDDFEHGFFAIVYGFFLSYLGYLILPAIGPRFTLHDFHSINTELPGLLLTSPLRSIINIGESIPDGTINPAALVQRDAFPSGHTQMTLVIMYLAAKFHCRTRWYLWVAGVLLIIGTVYLRYHYVIDLIGGAILMVLTIWTAPRLERFWNRRTGRSDRGNNRTEART